MAYPQVLNPAVLAQVQQVNRVQRKLRAPSHTFYVSHRPWQLQPFFIAPVLPGETMKSLNIQSRVISDPLKRGAGNILPWWCEHWFFYVKLRDLDIRDEVENLMLKGEPLTAAGFTAADVPTYHRQGVNFVRLALKRITEEYFRDEGEPWTDGALDGLPTQAAIKRGNNWAQSLVSVDAMTAMVENEPQQPAWPVLDEAYIEQYNAMRAMGAISAEMTYEDWLGTFGIRGPDAVEAHKPELIRYLSDWTYPSNTIDPATGDPSGAASFSVTGRADKDRFFSEPGFLIGITSVRPKLFMGAQTSTASVLLNDWKAWLPALMRDQPHTSVTKVVGANGPLSGMDADGYWADLRDLFLYGDQFVRGDLGGFAPALPTAVGEYRYATAAMADALFTAPTANMFRQDGIVTPRILSHPTTATDLT